MKKAEREVLAYIQKTGVTNPKQIKLRIKTDLTNTEIDDRW